MPVRKIRWLGLALLASTGAGLLALTSILHSAFAFADHTALVMGPSGFPVRRPCPWGHPARIRRDPVRGRAAGR